MQSKEKFVLVTGASTGIGKATAIECAKFGYKVGLVGRNQSGLEATKSQVQETGGQATIYLGDLSQTSQLTNLIEAVKSSQKNVHALINIAGIWHSEEKVFAGIEYQNFDPQVIIDTYMVGSIAPALLAHGLLPLMPKGSKIVNLSGTFEDGAKGWLPYFVSKRSIEDFTIGLSQELKSKDIQVNCVSPSDTATENYAKFFPEFTGQSIDPEVIAREIVRLCSPQANAITGRVFVIKKGMEIQERFHS